MCYRLHRIGLLDILDSEFAGQASSAHLDIACIQEHQAAHYRIPLHMRRIVVGLFLCLPAKKYRVDMNDNVSCCVLTLFSQARMPHIHEHWPYG